MNDIQKKKLSLEREEYLNKKYIIEQKGDAIRLVKVGWFGIKRKISVPDDWWEELPMENYIQYKKYLIKHDVLMFIRDISKWTEVG